MKVIETPRDVVQEVLGERRLYSKTFLRPPRQPGQTRYRTICSHAIVHVPADVTGWRQGDAPTFQDVEYDVVDAGSTFRVRNAWYTISIPKNKIAYAYQSKTAGRVNVALSEINKTALPSVPGLIVQPQFEDNHIIWEGVQPGLDFILTLRPGYVEMSKRIRTLAAPHAFAWEVQEDLGALSFQRMTKGYDNENNLPAVRSVRGASQRALEIRSEWTPDDFSTNPGMNTRRFREEITGQVINVDRKTRRKTLVQDRVYPLMIDATVTEDIVAGGDDGYENGNYVYWWFDGDGSNLIRAGWFYGDVDPGFRFQSIAVPNGNTIDSGTQLELRVNSAYADEDPSLTVYGDDVDDAAVWGDASLPSGITNTTASTAWNPVRTGLPRTDTIDVQAIVAEIVARGGWATGQDMRFALIGTQKTGSADLVYIRDYVHASWANDARLVIEHSSGYTPPSGTIDSPPGPVQIYVGESVNFLSSVSDGTPPYTHSWIFEAGSGISENTNADPGAIQFDVAGTWTVTYTVTDDVPNADSSPPSVEISVLDPATTTILPIMQYYSRR